MTTSRTPEKATDPAVEAEVELRAILATEVPYVRDMNTSQDKADVASMIARCRIHARKAIDLLTRLASDKARLEGERDAEWAKFFGEGREESWKDTAEREKARAERAEAERDAATKRASELAMALKALDDAICGDTTKAHGRADLRQALIRARALTGEGAEK